MNRWKRIFFFFFREGMKFNHHIQEYGRLLAPMGGAASIGLSIPIANSPYARTLFNISNVFCFVFIFVPPHTENLLP